jgi:nitrite reductase/ring-hydroxylating ferredoxin subunit
MTAQFIESFTRTIEIDVLTKPGVANVEINGWHILIARTEAGLYAMNDRCSHAASLLSPGRIRHNAIMCPLHGARFELDSGRCIGGAHRPVRVFKVRENDGWIEVAVPEAGPSPNESPVISARPST